MIPVHLSGRRWPRPAVIRTEVKGASSGISYKFFGKIRILFKINLSFNMTSLKIKLFSLLYKPRLLLINGDHELHQDFVNLSKSLYQAWRVIASVWLRLLSLLTLMSVH